MTVVRAGYMKRNELLARQDAQEQKRNIDNLILRCAGMYKLSDE